MNDLNPCHAHFKQRVEEVKRGVWQAGGFPVELPVMTLSEPFEKPTTMLYRNLLAMDAEGVGGKAFNVAAGQRTTLNELLRTL